ncbi:METTL5 family protein [Natronosalvus vescus]|uniref:METTL5 family protein n=1 Tax=Natronosalvus vescus TaxID=2953881 RepID=UPI0020910E32|nr:METTL5 family protein [Natronosalvus vescus]
MPAGPARRQLAQLLESVADFPDPRVDREQYLTPAELAAHVVHLAAVQGDLTNATVIDLGTGTGMLALAAEQYAPARTIGLDVDANALEQARINEHTIRTLVLEATPSDGSEEVSEQIRHTVDWLRADIDHVPLDRTTLHSPVTVLSNPPFGAQHRNRHADRGFLEVASELSDVSYTIHNEGSQNFIESFASDDGGTVTHAFGATFPVDHRFDFHDRERATLEAEVFRIEWSGE